MDEFDVEFNLCTIFENGNSCFKYDDLNTRCILISDILVIVFVACLNKTNQKMHSCIVIVVLIMI